MHACTHAKSLQLCLTVRTYGQQPTRLPYPRDSLGKNTGEGCHLEWLSLKRQKVSVDRDVEKRESLYTQRECKLVQQSWKIVSRFFKKLKIELTYDPASSFLGIYPNELKSGSLRYLHSHVYCSIIHSS